MNRKASVIGLIITFMLFASCYTPSPLYGNWADNDGNKISFTSDGTFVAKITKGNTDVTYQGNYVVVDNVVQFSTNDGIVINSEWDIRGSLLYISWTKGGVVYNLTLYHVSK